MIEFVKTHWLQILAATTTAYTFTVEAFSRISQALPAPTAESNAKYRWWFVFVNNLARNPARAQNLSRIEDSPNFLPAAEAYHKEQLKKNGQEN